LVADTRKCEQCGTLFTPRREHARFCSARCRVAWNRANASDRTVEASALDWSITAMRDATGRLLRARAQDRLRALAAISDAVWWVTIVDGTLVRHHPETYDAALRRHAPAERHRIEGTLAGLRFVRNRLAADMDHADFVDLRPSSAGHGDRRITAWTWKSVPAPALTALPPRGQLWEMTRYRAYQAHLPDRTVEETFGRAAAFLKLAGATLTSPNHANANHSQADIALH
jgi:hypothetical protein